ncbi:MAG: hypothetical protein LBI02_11225 [Opitutaceae bacterium]|jgi:processive 1,2-diacylglycerol beta-glucosyltransferase|nr:hypothetical protein [Opitutaceae bacterium]
MTPRKLLFLSVSAGAGHVRAAQALHAWGADAFGGRIESRHLDVMDYVPASFRGMYVSGYLKLIQHLPSMWGLLYRATDKTSPDAIPQKLRRAVERLGTRALTKAIADFAPDTIISTHFLPAELLAGQTRRGKLDLPLWVLVTDFDLHRMWVQPHMTGYFAANDEVKFRLQAHGIDPARVHVTGIPVMPAFSRPLPRATCAAEAGLAPDRATVLLMGGGAGVGHLDTVAASLLALPRDFQLIVLAGKNRKALAALQRLADRHPGRLFPQGFTNQVERLMACADVAITKPGGLTTSECLALGLPMIVHSPIPGQEEHNADYLLEAGVALKAIDETGMEYRLDKLLASPKTLAAMRARAQSLGRPRAGHDVLRIVLGETT